MVGVGPGGLDSVVARVTICNWAEEVILDTYVQVSTKVTDYRTFVSGVKATDLEGSRAMPLEQVRGLVKNILHGKILIGHALENDLAALNITHPWHDIRDTADYLPFMKEIRDGEERCIMAPRKLKELALDHLGRDIQAQGRAHNPIEDARTALRLYKSERMAWEMMVMAQVQALSPRDEELRETRHSPGNQSPYLAQSLTNRSAYSGGRSQRKHHYTSSNCPPRNNFVPTHQRYMPNYSGQYASQHHPMMPFH